MAFDATKEQIPCPQIAPMAIVPLSNATVEDCLTLNVYTPNKAIVNSIKNIFISSHIKVTNQRLVLNYCSYLYNREITPFHIKNLFPLYFLFMVRTTNYCIKTSVFEFQLLETNCTGGSFIRWSGNMWNAGRLLERDLVVVSINYRLGPLGKQINFIQIIFSTDYTLSLWCPLQDSSA